MERSEAEGHKQKGGPFKQGAIKRESRERQLAKHDVEQEERGIPARGPYCQHRRKRMQASRLDWMLFRANQ